MRVYHGGPLSILVCLVTIATFTGCGVSGKKIEEAEQRIEALEIKGAPDTLLSKAKVFLFNVKGAKKSGNAGQIRKNYDSLLIYLQKAEGDYAADMERFKPYVDSLIVSIEARTEGLSGRHLAVADSLKAVVDSFVAKKWLRQAKEEAEKLDALLPALHEQQETAEKLRSKVRGTWKTQNVPGDKRFKALETKVFSFNGDGTVKMTEKMKGQTSEYLKEDWHFISNGTWDLKGDTVLIHVTDEKCLKQTFWNKQKGKWVRDAKPTYDTTYTDDSKDRWMIYSELKEEFRKL
jgi:uncharacterized coiled-coil protein SlyX